MERRAEPLGAGRGPVGVPPSGTDVRAELARILDSPALRVSARRRALLSYLVEETLAGRGDRLKGFTVALAVFGRDETFDPQSDPVVRFEARRLRRDLDSYYVDAGSRDPLRITIPKGGYVPHFEWQGQAPPPEPPDDAPPLVVAALADTPAAAASPAAAGRAGGWRGLLRVALAALALFAAVAVGAWVWLDGRPPAAVVRGPSVIVLPFAALSDGEGDGFLAAGLAQDLITNLMRFDGFRLYSVPASFRHDGDADPVALGHELGVDYVVKGSVSSDAAAVRVGAQLYSARTGQALWSETYDRPPMSGALIGVRTELADSIATALGQPYGIVRNDVTARLARGEGPSRPSYDCLLRANSYRRTFATELYAPVLACLEAAVARDPDYADAWAMLGWMHLDAARFGLVAEAGTGQAHQQALAAATHAVSLDGGSILALQALASIHHYMGHFAESERIQRQALALNPNDPDTLAQLGWRLAVRGRWDEGIPYLERAIARTVSPPGWYFDLVAVHEYLEGDYAAMLAAAERSAVDGSGISQSFIAIAEGALGAKAAARETLGRMAETSPGFIRDPAAAYRVHHPTEAIVSALMAGLREAGWTAPADAAIR